MSHLTWYVARSSGIVGWALLSASVLWGLALSTHLSHGRPRPAWLLDLHRFLGACALVFTGVHVGAILLDSYTDISVVNALVPLTGTWHPLALAWGVVALYLLVAVEVTSLLRTRLPRRVWRATHYASLPLFTFATVHLLTAGTEATSGPLRWAAVAVSVAVGVLTWRRVRQAEEADLRRAGLRATVAERPPAGRTGWLRARPTTPVRPPPRTSAPRSAAPRT